MKGMLAVYRKELADQFSSHRFVILFALIAMVGFITVYLAGVSLRENLEGVAKPRFVFLMLFNTTGALFSLVQFVAFFGPLVGLVLGFDAVNRERAQGTLIKLLTQPVFRDAVINGKLLAGVTTIAVMLAAIVSLVSGLGLTVLGIVPGLEEILRLALYLVVSIFYIAFWLGIAMLFSILFRSIPTSALASVALWIFLSFFVSMGAEALAGALAPMDRTRGVTREDLLRNARIQERVRLVSPLILYSRASGTLIDPLQNTTRSVVLMGPREQVSARRFQGPLPLGQSLLVIGPHLAALVAMTLVCFGVSYTLFMVQEIRA